MRYISLIIGGGIACGITGVVFGDPFPELAQNFVMFSAGVLGAFLTSKGGAA